MEDNITNAVLGFTCTQDWNQMLPQNNGRFCNKCQKTVHDLTDQKAAYFLELLDKSSTGICARFKHDQMAVQDNPKPFWKRAAIATMVFVGLGSFAQKVVAQDAPCKPSQSTVADSQAGRIVLGYVKKMPNFLSSEELMPIRNFLIKNCKFDFGAEGSYYVRFDIETEGSIVQESILISKPFNGGGPDVSDEIIKTLKRAPRLINFLRDEKRPTNQAILILPVRQGKIGYISKEELISEIRSLEEKTIR